MSPFLAFDLRELIHVFFLAQQRLLAAEKLARRSAFTPIALYTNVDAQSDKLATKVGRTKLTTLVTVDVLWEFFISADFGTK